MLESDLQLLKPSTFLPTSSSRLREALYLKVRGPVGRVYIHDLKCRLDVCMISKKT